MQMINVAENIIKVSKKEKSTSIRLSEKTKKMLDALAIGKETHEEILLRLIKMSNTLSSEGGSQIVDKKNVIGTKYERVNKTINVETAKGKYSIVCTYNDLGIFAILRSKQLVRNVGSGRLSEWEVGLDIVNIKKNNKGWEQPSNLTKEDKLEYLLLYFVLLKQILEETFDIKLYEITTDDDFFSLDKWEKTYNRNNLPSESYIYDVERKLSGHN